MSDPPLPAVLYRLEFTKGDADALMSCLDVTLKSAGLPACQSVTLWCDKVRAAMLPVQQEAAPATTPERLH